MKKLKLNSFKNIALAGSALLIMVGCSSDDNPQPNIDLGNGSAFIFNGAPQICGEPFEEQAEEIIFYEGFDLENYPLDDTILVN